MIPPVVVLVAYLGAARKIARETVADLALSLGCALIQLGWRVAPKPPPSAAAVAATSAPAPAAVASRATPIGIAPEARRPMRGGPDVCPRPCSECSGEHHFGEPQGLADLDPDHPAARSGLSSWWQCKHCAAWRGPFTGGAS